MAQKREIKEETELKVSDGFEKARSLSLRFSERPDPLQESSDDPGQGQGQGQGQDQNPGARREVNRCSECRRKVGLTGFRCRCGDLFCSLHRYSDRHECGFDYKAAGRAAIARENPVVRPAKILKV